jgi:putative ABC transport system permease protein
MLVESLLISSVGGLLGLALGDQAIRLILAAAPADLPRLDEIHLDARVLIFTVAISVLTGLLVAVLPVWHFTGADPQEAIQPGSMRATAARANSRLRSLLVALEVGLSTMCLLAGGLLLHSFANLLATDRGFDIQRIVTVDVNLPSGRYPTVEARATFVRSVLQGIESLPGIVSAGVSNKLPLSGEGEGGLVSLEGVTVPPLERPTAEFRFVNSNYFQTLAIPIRAGRIFEDADRHRPVAVVSALAADRLWPGANALAKRFRIGAASTSLIEVVGVVGDVRGASLEQNPTLTVYAPYWQRMPPGLSVAVRTVAEPSMASSVIRDVVHRTDPELPLPAFRTMDEVLTASVAERRFQLSLVLLFAVAATLLASLGIYGVVSYSVAQRTNEIGIRLALGAQPREIRRLVLRQGLTPVILGLVAGVASSLGLGRVLRGLLFGVGLTDPLAIAGVVVTLAAVAVAANYLPARSATRVDPLRALRCD